MSEKAPAHDLVSQLEKLLKEECALYRRYLEILPQERKVVTKFNAETLSALTAEREELQQQFEIAQRSRLSLLKILPRGDRTKLSELLRLYFEPKDQARLAPLVEELRSLAAKVRREGSDFRQVIEFGLSIIQGTLAIFYSATQHVVKRYTARGALEQSYHPVGSRQASVIKQA
jgi:flagellar biosynthesis/type III secretory pathway chaperone